MRVKKDGAAGAAAGMGVGPLAADNAWTGGKVHVNAIGSRPPHKKHVKPSFHKSLEELFKNYGCGQISKGRKRHDVCPAGQHRHEGADYCHPEGQKHRGDAPAKPEKPKGKRGRPEKPCEAGEHRHDGADFCHPEKRKHRGMKVGFSHREEVAHSAEEEEPKAPEPKKRGTKAYRPFPPSNRIWREYVKADYTLPDGSRNPDKDKLQDLYHEAYNWERSPEGRAFLKEAKNKRLGAQGAKGVAHYRQRLSSLEQQAVLLKDTHRGLSDAYTTATNAWAARKADLSGKYGYNQYGGVNKDNVPVDELEEFLRLKDVADRARDVYHTSYKEFDNLQKAIKRAKSQAGIAIAKDWIGLIPKIAGGLKAEIDVVTIGSKTYAHYQAQDKRIGISDNALAALNKIYDNPDLLFGTQAATYGFAVGALLHEFLHSVNHNWFRNHEGYGGEYSVPRALEEGLVEAVSNRMVARPEVLSALIGRTVEKGATAKPQHKDYILWTDGVNYCAEKAALKSGHAPEWFLGKWKFHIDPHERMNIIAEDAGLETVQPGGGVNWLRVFSDAKDDLPKVREERMEQQKESFKKALEPLWGLLIPGFPLEDEISRGRVYVHEGEQAPEGTPTQQGPRGGTYYEAQPHFKQGDLVAVRDLFNGKKMEEAIFQGIDERYGNAIVEIQSPYGNQEKLVDVKNLELLAPGHHPDKGQKERREKRQAQALGEVVTQFANTFRQAQKLEWNILLHQEAGGKWVREALVRGDRDIAFERYRTDDGIEVYAPQADDPRNRLTRKVASLSLNRLLNYVSKMPPLAVQDLRKSVKRIILSPHEYVVDPHVWGTMNHDGDLTIYPNTKDIKAYSAGGFHGPDVGLPDIAVARILTHETGHAVENRVEELRKPYYDKRREFWEAYEKAGGHMPADDANILKIQQENGFPDPPTEAWWAEYGDMKEIDRARYNPTEPKIPEYNIPAEVRGALPKLHRPEPLHDANDIYAWNDLPPKVKLAMLEKIRRAKPVTGYAETNRAEYYAEAYEQFRYGILPSDHILYKHFEELPKIEAFVNMPEIKITKVWHRHGPADWNDDAGTYHAHENAKKGHDHESNG